MVKKDLLVLYFEKNNKSFLISFFNLQLPYTDLHVLLTYLRMLHLMLMSLVNNLTLFERQIFSQSYEYLQKNVLRNCFPSYHIGFKRA